MSILKVRPRAQLAVVRRVLRAVGPRPDREGPEPPVDSVRGRLQLAAQSGGRGVTWAILMVSLFGTVMTAPVLPYPLSVFVLVPSMAGAICAACAALFRCFVAFTAALDAIRLASAKRSARRTAGI
jgi:hypothetical protein